MLCSGGTLIKGSGIIFTGAVSTQITPADFSLRKLLVILYRVTHAIFLFAMMTVYLWVSLEPMAQINSLTPTNVLPLSMTAKSTVSNLISSTRPYYVSSGYGLFRVMTGVGESSKVVGIGGVRPPVVARPEIILEGTVLIPVMQ